MGKLYPPIRSGENFVGEDAEHGGQWYIEKNQDRIVKEVSGVDWEYFEREFEPLIKNLRLYLPEYLPKFETVVSGKTKNKPIKIYYTQDVIQGHSLSSERSDIPKEFFFQLDDLLEKNARMYIDTGRALEFDPKNLFWGHTKDSSTDHLYAIDLNPIWNEETVDIHYRVGGEQDPVIQEIEWLIEPYSKDYDFPKAKKIISQLKILKNAN